MNCVLRFLRFIDDDCNDDLRLPLYVIDGRIILFVRAWGLSDRSTKLKLWESVSGRVVPTAMIYSEWEYSRLLRCLLCNRRVAKFVFFFFCLFDSKSTCIILEKSILLSNILSYIWYVIHCLHFKAHELMSNRSSLPKCQSISFRYCHKTYSFVDVELIVTCFGRQYSDDSSLI